MPDSEERVPVAEEVLTVGKRAVPIGRVRVETRTETIEEIATAALETNEVEILRVPIGREVDTAPAVRTEGGVTIVPVVEERLVVQRRLVLREELHIKRRRTSETVEVPIQVRKQRAFISREGRNTSEGSAAMTDTSMASGYRTLTAFFDDRAAAERAMQRLRDVGVSDTSIRLAGGEEYVGRAAYREDRGFWDSLLDFFFPPEDSATYAEGIRRGGYLLSVGARGSAEQYDQIVEILDEEGSIDLDERASSWRGEGWSDRGDAMVGGSDTGGSSSAGSLADATAGTRRDEVGHAGTMSGAGSGALGGAAAGLAGETPEAWRGEAAGTRDDETIPVVEERLRVGKRDVGLGRVRVRSYVVEEPVSADVRLREERVEVERRPVDRPLGF